MAPAVLPSSPERIRPGALSIVATVVLAVALLASPARAEIGEIQILVLKEHGVGSPSLAQPYVDRFVALATRANDWDAGKGQYLNSRSAAESFIKAHGPHYGILSLAAFLALRKPYNLTVVGRVSSALAGGEQYFIVSRSETNLAGCKGKTLATDHADDVRFVEKVVARSAFKLADFTVVENQRPLQSLKQMMNGEASCALIDDAQLAELAHLPGSDAVKTVWSSEKLPPMAVVAFPAAPSGERAKFQESLSGLCRDDGQTACQEVGIHALEPASAADYRSVVSAYGR